MHNIAMICRLRSSVYGNVISSLEKTIDKNDIELSKFQENPLSGARIVWDYIELLRGDRHSANSPARLPGVITKVSARYGSPC